jgi:spermidine synthase
MEMNGGWASGIEQTTRQSFFPYVTYIKKIIQASQPKNIAIIGAAGCTLPQEIASQSSLNAIDVIDIDKRVFPIAEKYFLEQPLDSKINPIVQSARGWIHDMKAQ